MAYRNAEPITAPEEQGSGNGPGGTGFRQQPWKRVHAAAPSRGAENRKALTMNDLPDILETTEAARQATGFVFTEGPLWHPDGFF
jgi:hypothetical protein